MKCPVVTRVVIKELQSQIFTYNSMQVASKQLEIFVGAVLLALSEKQTIARDWNIGSMGVNPSVPPQE